MACCWHKNGGRPANHRECLEATRSGYAKWINQVNEDTGIARRPRSRLLRLDRLTMDEIGFLSGLFAPDLGQNPLPLPLLLLPLSAETNRAHYPAC